MTTTFPLGRPSQDHAHMPLATRVDHLDWPSLTAQLDDTGSALTDPLLTPQECREIAGLYDDATRFRSTVDMARLRFGAGQYRYFDHPLPTPSPPCAQRSTGACSPSPATGPNGCASR